VKAILERLKRSSAEPKDEAEPAVEEGFGLLFVCMGNICRSPTAEAVFRKVWQERAPDLLLRLDSAGTHAYHIGEPPDPRAQRAALRRGVDLAGLRARRVEPTDFERFDLVLGMDEANVEILRVAAPVEYRERIRLMLEFAPHLGRTDVPDPYYGGSNGFEHVLDLVEEASIGLLEHVRQHLQTARTR
jgi:protein-tyrosine phosphatase